MKTTDIYPSSYEESRTKFRQEFDRVRRLWPNAGLHDCPVGGDEGLTIDWIEADARAGKDKLLIFTTGEHGIEGYVGSAMLRLFLKEYLERLDPSSTGLLLVHAINPWGMKWWRRANAANVDLNRNFLMQAQGFDPSFNREYSRLSPLLLPKGPIRGRFRSDLAFVSRMAFSLLTSGTRTIRRATLLGQYGFPHGIYFGGETWQEETRLLMGLYRAKLGKYGRVVHMDMHSGYGPRYQMSLVNSWREPRDSRELEREFAYPLVVKSNPAEFFSVQGDMIDFMYSLAMDEFPGKRLYATSFEFGTYGDSTSADIRALRTLILENQLHWRGTGNQNLREGLERDYRELFFPSEERWRDKAAADTRQAFEGILSAEGFF